MRADLRHPCTTRATRADELASGLRTASRTRSRFRFLVRLPERCRRSDALRHQNVRLAETVGVGNHSHDDEAELLIKLVGVVAKVPDVSNVLPDVRIQIDSRDRGLALLVVSAEIDGASAMRDDAVLEVAYQRATDSASLLVEPYDERMKLPRVSVVVFDAANSADRPALIVDRDAADAIRRE
jgi:hypothetical protein